MDINIVPNMLTYLTLFSDAFIIFVGLALLFSKFSKKIFIFKNKLLKIISKQSMKLSFAVAATATLGSLYYSQVMGYAPCELCWYQRIFMYPQVLLFAVGILKNNKQAFYYSFPMSVIGLIIATVHYIMQMTKIDIISCDALGYSANCTATFFAHFGYITIPMMSITAFMLLIIFQVVKIGKEGDVK